MNCSLPVSRLLTVGENEAVLLEYVESFVTWSLDNPEGKTDRVEKTFWM